MIARRLLPTIAFLLPLFAGARDMPDASAGGTRHDVVFTRYAPLSRGTE